MVVLHRAGVVVFRSLSDDQEVALRHEKLIRCMKFSEIRTQLHTKNVFTDDELDTVGFDKVISIFSQMLNMADVVTGKQYMMQCVRKAG